LNKKDKIKESKKKSSKDILAIARALDIDCNNIKQLLLLRSVTVQPGIVTCSAKHPEIKGLVKQGAGKLRGFPIPAKG
jgi:hypothetical protein